MLGAHVTSTLTLIILSLPSQHAISFTYLLRLHPYSFLGNPQCNKGDYSLALTSIHPVIIPTIALLSSAQSFYEWDRCWESTVFPPYNPQFLLLFPLLCLSPTFYLEHFLRVLRKSPGSGFTTQVADIRKPWTF
jgi:hypothetical protein